MQTIWPGSLPSQPFRSVPLTETSKILSGGDSTISLPEYNVEICMAPVNVEDVCFPAYSRVENDCGPWSGEDL